MASQRPSTRRLQAASRGSRGSSRAAAAARGSTATASSRSRRAGARQSTGRVPARRASQRYEEEEYEGDDAEAPRSFGGLTQHQLYAVIGGAAGLLLLIVIVIASSSGSRPKSSINGSDDRDTDYVQPGSSNWNGRGTGSGWNGPHVNDFDNEDWENEDADWDENNPLTNRNDRRNNAWRDRENRD